jgi:putative lipoprotein
MQRTRYARLRYFYSAWAVSLAIFSSHCVAQAERLTGTAVYRERLALPPNAIFEALLEDLSKADAASQIISSVRLDNPGQPPIRFHIEFDPQRITEQRSYSVRARITVGGRLWFITARPPSSK